MNTCQNYLLAIAHLLNARIILEAVEVGQAPKNVSSAIHEQITVLEKEYLACITKK